MNRPIFGLITILFLVPIIACELPSLALNATPTLTPDVSTRVAGTVTAVFATEIARVIQTPTPSKTPEPTATPLPPSLTATFTRTIVPTSTPTAAGKLIQGSVYGIRVLQVETSDQSFVDPSSSPPFYKSISPATGNTFLKVKIQLFKNDIEAGIEEFRKERTEISVVDAKGQAFTPNNLLIQHYNNEGTLANIFTVVFDVPKDSTGFKLRYRDLPLIDLSR